MDILGVLGKCPFVGDLSDEQLKIIAKFAKEETYEVGEPLVKQGRTGGKIFLVEEGLVGIYLEVGPMTQRMLQPASNYDLVGWTSMLPPYRALCTAKAIETTSVLAFDAMDLVELCDKNPEIGNKVHRALASLIALRLHNAFAQLLGVTSHDMG